MLEGNRRLPQPSRSATILVLVAMLVAACGGGETATSNETSTEAAETAAASTEPRPTPAGDTEGAWSPERDVVFTVPYAAGGGTDQMARAIAAGLEEVRPELTIVVENRPGGSGVPGYSHAHQQAGDPHQLVTAEQNVVTVPMLTDAPFHWSDFTPIGQVSDLVGMAVSQSGKYEDLPDLVESAASERTTVGLAGLSGPLAVAAALTELATDATFERVVFDGGNEITKAVLAGDVDFGIPAPQHAVEHMRAGTLDALAVFSDERLQLGVLADVPTAAEQGVDVEFAGFRGLFGAPDITNAQRRYWIDAFEDWTETESFQQYVEDNFSLRKVRLGDEFTSYLEEFETKVQPAVDAIEQMQQ